MKRVVYGCNINKKININTEMQQSYLTTMSVMFRALPDARDGCSFSGDPVAMYDMGIRPDQLHRKSARPLARFSEISSAR